MRKKELFEEIKKEERKYSSLLWYARVGNDIQLPRVNQDGKLIDYIEEHKSEIEKLYPKETKDLTGEHGDWEHGFNSGMVAALRYILTMDDTGLEQAKKEFPFLDS